ncbi:MAG: hypothetical protein JW910_00645, partial [Anaerolineae bacterium]|nr:hypothetical protein [Anaerolineae bacterium]
FGPYAGGVLHHVEISRPASEVRFWFDAVQIVDLSSAVPALPNDALSNEDAAGFYYTGNWGVKSKPLAIGGVVYKARDWYAGVAFHFNGTAFTFYTRFGPNEGAVMVCIDGDCMPVSLTQSTKLWGLDASVSITNLSDGPHVVGFHRMPGGKFFFDGVYVGSTPPVPPTAAGVIVDWATGTTTFYAPDDPGSGDHPADIDPGVTGPRDPTVPPEPRHPTSTTGAGHH